jgi:hypothetical protein
MPEAHESHIQPVPEAIISIPLSLIRLYIKTYGPPRPQAASAI